MSNGSYSAPAIRPKTGVLTSHPHWDFICIRIA